MLSIVRFKGGLGNQMFQYAFFLSLKKRHPFSWFLFDLDESLSSHSGYQLDIISNANTLWRNKWFRRIKKYFPILIKKTRIIKQANSLEFCKKYYQKNSTFTLYDGYWQSEKYFKNIANIVQKTFTFNEELLNKQSKQLASSIGEKNYVSVHIRRGDYLNLTDYLGICDISYYLGAIDYIKNNIHNPTFVFFSDDIPWVKESIIEENAMYVDWNQGKDSWQDMYLMSKCQHNIIANSSFSWWGAWLNNNPQKIVVAPKQWFKYSPNYDIIPDGWITIDC